MYEKTVRRRRAVLALLVALSLILLTVYFGESPGGRLHSVQRGFMTVISPIEDGASKALKPIRDFFGGIGSTFHAKAEVKTLTKENDRLRAQLVLAQLAAQRGTQLAAQFHLDQELSLHDYSPVNANVIEQSPTLWFSTVVIDRGSGAGIHTNDPVVDGEGLVGTVTQVVPDAAQVTLITDQSSGVAAADAATAERGLVEPKVGDPQNLLMQYLPLHAHVQPGDYVVTSGTVSAQDPDLFPPGIPIGQVTSVNSADIYTSVSVRPLANLNELGTVQVLTQGTTGASAQRISNAISQLPAAGSEPHSSLGAPTVQQASAGGGTGG